MGLVTSKEVSKVIGLQKFRFLGTFIGWIIIRILSISHINNLYNKNKNKSDLEYLLEVDEDGQRLNTFTIPEDLTPDNIEMYQTGEMTRTFTQVEQYINA